MPLMLAPLHALPGRAPDGMSGRLERVTGPWQSLFVAAYTTYVGGSFYGYAKIFRVPPDDVWNLPAVAKIGSAFGYANEEHALEEAESRALFAVTRLGAFGHRFRRGVRARSSTSVQ